MRKQLSRFLLLMLTFSIPYFTFGQYGEVEGMLTGNDMDNSPSTSVDYPMVIGKTLYQQTGVNSSTHLSNNFFTSSVLTNFSTFLADDFTVPEGESWEVKYLRSFMYSPYSFDSVVGYNICVYNDDAGKPGEVFYKADLQKNMQYKRQASYVTGAYDVFVSLDAKATIPSGKYWLLVQPVNNVAKMVSGAPGFWVSNIFIKSSDAVGSQACFKEPGQAYYNFPNWTSLGDFWVKNNGYDKKLYNINFGLYADVVTTDLAITGIPAPVDGELLSNAEEGQIIIQNHGTADVEANSFEIVYRSNGVEVGRETVAVAIPSGQEVTYTCRNKFNLSAKGVYKIEAEIVMASDEIPENNKYYVEVENFGKILKAVANTKVEYVTCEGTFTDHGGLSDHNVSYSFDTVVFYPGSKGKRIRLEFYRTDMYGARKFQFFNGPSTSSPLLANPWIADVDSLIIEGVNPQGAITVICPDLDAKPDENNDNFYARVMCVEQTNNEFAIKDLNANFDFPAVGNEVKVTADILGKGMDQGTTIVSFFANNQPIGQVSATVALGETKNPSVIWSPEAAGNYILKATIPSDEGIFAEDKIFEKSIKVLPKGAIIESFEHNGNYPEEWASKIRGGISFLSINPNERDLWDGNHYGSFGTDTLVTPKVDITPNDTISFLFSTGVLGGKLDLLYSQSQNGPWTKFSSVSPSTFVTTKKVTTSKIPAGAYYIGFNGGGTTCVFDYIRGLNYHFDNNDLKILSFKGESIVKVKEPNEYTVEIKNTGLNTLTNYSVVLCKMVNGQETILKTLPGMEITSSNKRSFVFNYSFDKAEEFELYSRVELEGDDEPSDNTSSIIKIHSLPEYIDRMLIGDNASESNDKSTLAYIQGNYAENLYLKENLNFKGEITGITLFYKNSLAKELPVRIYMGETAVTKLEKFQSVNDMVMVYNDTLEIEYCPNTYTKLYIPFKKPFLYSGEKNLVFTFYRRQAEDWNHTRRITLQATETSYISHKGHSLQSYEITVDITSATALNSFKSSSTLQKSLPNISFIVNQSNATASIAGMVTSGTEKIAKAQLSFDRYANLVYTNDTGYYSFPVMAWGDAKVMVEKYGYYSQSKDTVFSGTNQTIVNFNLKALPAVSVTGLVLANDSLKPLSGVTVVLSGYNLELSVQTDNEGKYKFDGVFGDKEYSVSFSHPRFISQVKTYYVPYENTDFGSVVLDEVEQTAFNLIAVHQSNNEVAVAWEAPFTGVKREMDPTGGAKYDYYWYNEVDEDVQLGNLVKVSKPGTVSTIKIWTAGWDKTTYGGSKAQEASLYIRVYNKNRVEIMKPVMFNMPDSTVKFLEIDVPDFSYNEDFYVMLHWDRVHVQTSGFMYHYFQDTNIAYYVDANGKWDLLSDIVGSQYAGAFSMKFEIIEKSENNSRALLNYDLWRMKTADVANEANWTKLNAEPISATNFSDTTFSLLENGYFQYALKANYTNGPSPYLMSNSLSKGLNSNVTINVTPNNGANIDGAVVSFIHENGNDLNQYSAFLNNGKVEFPLVYKGKYALSITKGAAYQPVNATINVQSDTILNFEIKEMRYPPVRLQVVNVENEDKAEFSWAIGKEKTYQIDDNTKEQALSIQQGNSAEIGNYFPVISSGQLISADIYVVNEGKKGKVAITVYNDNKEQIFESAPVYLDNNGVDAFVNVPLNLTEFNGAFFIMVKYLADETEAANAIGMDTDENPGHGYFNDKDNKFVMLSSWGYYGNFLMRANVLENGKKSAKVYDSGDLLNKPANSIPQFVEFTNAESVYVKAPAAEKLYTFNVYLDNMDTPLATSLSDAKFVFTKQEHLTKDGSATYKAGVQSVYASGSSAVVAINFVYPVLSADESINNTLSLYPNPANHVLNFSSSFEGTIRVYNSVGKLVFTQSGAMQTIDVSSLSEGFYLIKAETKAGVFNSSFIIDRQ